MPCGFDTFVGKEGFRMDMMGILDGKLERDQTGRGSCPQHGYKFWLSVPGWTEEIAAMFFFSEKCCIIFQYCLSSWHVTSRSPF